MIITLCDDRMNGKLDVGYAYLKDGNLLGAVKELFAVVEGILGPEKNISIPERIAPKQTAPYSVEQAPQV